MLCWYCSCCWTSCGSSQTDPSHDRREPHQAWSQLRSQPCPLCDCSSSSFTFCTRVIVVAMSPMSRSELTNIVCPLLLGLRWLPNLPAIGFLRGSRNVAAIPHLRNSDPDPLDSESVPLPLAISPRRVKSVVLFCVHSLCLKFHSLFFHWQKARNV